jgi:hypothetical protein
MEAVVCASIPNRSWGFNIAVDSTVQLGWVTFIKYLYNAFAVTVSILLSVVDQWVELLAVLHILLVFVLVFLQGSFNRFASPELVFPFKEGASMSDVEIINPVFDYVPPDLVTLFITNM